MTTKLTLSSLPDLLAICKLSSRHKIPDWATRSRFSSITRSPDELSIVCAQADVPAGVDCEPDWRCLKVDGPLDFALTGILAALSTVLAGAGISIFALSTYETDYLLVKAEKLAQAIQVLEAAGYRIRADGFE